MAFPLERQTEKQIFPFPEEGRVVEENPPCFSWLPADGEQAYTVTVKDASGRVVCQMQTEKNYAVPEKFLPAGKYVWDVCTPSGDRRGELSFTLSEHAVKIPRVGAETLFSGVPDVRPRHLFFKEDIPALLGRTKEIAVLRRNIAKALTDGSPEPPRFHRDPDALPYREYFGRFRDYVDRDLVALSLGYALLGDEEAGRAGKKLLLDLCDMNPHGPCSLLGKWGDEVGLSMARCLPSAFDCLYPLLSPAERDFVAATVRTYAEQCYDRLKKLNYCENPGDSHAGRVPAYLGEAALVLKGTGVQPEEEAIRWLSYALEIYGGIFPYYGTPDGGWAEGAFYATSYTKWFLPFFSAVERYGGTKFLDRPFYQRLCGYFCHFANPHSENHPFGDGYWCHPEDAEWPGFFAQDPFRYYARRHRVPEAAALSEQLSDPSLYLLHLLDAFLPVPENAENSLVTPVGRLGVFPDAGFVGYHSDLLRGENDISLLVRASKFGSDSHRHPDQGSFALFKGGNALISPSGYFGRRYGTLHHRNWLNETRAHNALLINGEGQPKNSRFSTGKILLAEEKEGVLTIKVDISSSYEALERWIRTFELKENVLTVTDEVEGKDEVTVGYPLHTLSRPELKGNTLFVTRGGASLTVVPEAGGLHAVSVKDEFDVPLNEGEPTEYAVTMPPQYHVLYETGKQKKHLIRVRYETA